MLPPGFEPESKPREGLMIGRTTLWEHIRYYPLDVISIKVNSSSSETGVVSGTGVFF